MRGLSDLGQVAESPNSAIQESREHGEVLEWGSAYVCDFMFGDVVRCSLETFA